MKVIHIIDSNGFGGAERYIIDLCTKLNSDYEVNAEIVTFHHNVSIEKVSELNEIKYSYISQNNKNSNLFFMRTIRRIYNENKLGILHTHGYRANILVRLALFFSSAEIVTTVHSSLNYWNNKLKSKIYSYMDRLTSGRNQKIISVSNFISNYYKNILNQHKIITIHNGVEGKNFQSREKKELKSKKTIISVANLIDVKNHITLLKAFNLLIKEHKQCNVELILIGEGQNRRIISDYIEKHHLNDHIKILGFIEEVDQYLSKSDFYVSTSFEESFGLSIVEAMFSRVPVIASRVGGVPEIIEDEVTGLLFNNPTDETELLDKILLLLNDEDLYNGIVDNAYKKCKDQFSLDLMVKRTYNVYREVIDKMV